MNAQPRFAAAQAAWDNRQPDDDIELTKAQEEKISKVLDWASIPDFVDEIDSGFWDIAKRRLSKEAQKDLADSIHDLVAKALGVAI